MHQQPSQGRGFRMEMYPVWHLMFSSVGILKPGKAIPPAHQEICIDHIKSFFIHRGVCLCCIYILKTVHSGRKDHHEHSHDCTVFRGRLTLCSFSSSIYIYSSLVGYMEPWYQQGSPWGFIKVFCLSQPLEHRGQVGLSSWKPAP